LLAAALDLVISALRQLGYRLSILIAADLLLAACGSSTTDRALSGGAIGAGAGAIGGALVGIPAAGAAIGAAAGVGVGLATMPTQRVAEAGAPSHPSSSDRVVITYLTNGRGFDEARAENVRFARRSCGGGAVLIAERSGEDATGTWLRLVYGCLANSAPPAQGPPVKPP
jgi:osmotically inducible lipoprotein OsmB